MGGCYLPLDMVNVQTEQMCLEKRIHCVHLLNLFDESLQAAGRDGREGRVFFLQKEQHSVTGSTVQATAKYSQSSNSTVSEVQPFRQPQNLHKAATIPVGRNNVNVTVSLSLEEL